MTSSPTTHRIAGALTLIAVLAVAGCTGAIPSPSSLAPSASDSVGASASPSEAASTSPSVAASASASATPSEPTESLPAFACTPTVAIPATAGRAQITDVRVAEHAGYDRVVFEFTGGVPQTLIEAVLPPFYQDASGLPLDVNGTAFLQVTMHNASRVTDGVVTYSGPLEFEPDLQQVVHLVEGGDFEAVSTWYLGLNGGGCLRVLTLAAPDRLVIDIEH